MAAHRRVCLSHHQQTRHGTLPAHVPPRAQRGMPCRVKGERLFAPFREAKALEAKFDSFDIQHVYRCAVLRCRVCWPHQAADWDGRQRACTGVCVCVCVRVRARVRACVRACACGCASMSRRVLLPMLPLLQAVGCRQHQRDALPVPCACRRQRPAALPPAGRTTPSRTSCPTSPWTQTRSWTRSRQARSRAAAAGARTRWRLCAQRLWTRT
jgi:hypothetical protein